MFLSLCSLKIQTLQSHFALFIRYWDLVSNRFKDQSVIIYEFDHNQERYHKTQGHQEFPPESVTKKQTIIEGVQSSNILSFCVKKLISQPWIVWEGHFQSCWWQPVLRIVLDQKNRLLVVCGRFFMCFFCRTKWLKVVFDRLHIACWWNLSFHFQFTTNWIVDTWNGL